jgi:hypothetical protein
MSARDHRDRGAKRQRFFRDAPPFLLRTVPALDDWRHGWSDVCDSGCWHRKWKPPGLSTRMRGKPYQRKTVVTGRLQECQGGEVMTVGGEGGLMGQRRFFYIGSG